MARVTDTTGRPVSGVVPYAVNAIVVDNDDPDQLGRVKVKYPTLPGQPESFWLRQVSPNGGGEHGLYALPEVGDEVLVVFLQGSHDRGVIVGALWNGASKPPTEAVDGMPTPDEAQISGARKSKDSFTAGSGDDADNDRRFWRSRSGHLLAFDDTSGSESVQIWDGTHIMSLVFDVATQRIILANTGKDIHLRTAQDIYLEAGRDILVQAGRHLEVNVGQDTKLEAGMTVQSKSGTDTTMEAGANMDLKAFGNLTAKASGNFSAEGIISTLKGSGTATLQGGGLAEVKAGMVKIN